ncbi:hypothetical protein BT63DRAFT_424523 [Microthyrium microscopicum]|uniref:Uncharacterized protein n=1 Tax=Microthyrium microscopicum TaxID=703497 RepID=A0A6A6UGM8_9PEZI|nr:hypothetical protein BT63DRAFT_424523 [Microthyrium microscopicum]
MQDKRATGEHSIPQSYVSAASQLLARLFSTALCSSLAVVFTQHLWYVLRDRPIKIDHLEKLYGIRENVLLLASPSGRLGDLEINETTIIGEWTSHYTPSGNWTVYAETRQTSCAPRIASYRLQTSFSGGSRKLSYVVKSIQPLTDMLGTEELQTGYNFPPGCKTNTESAYWPVNDTTSDQLLVLNVYSIIDAVVSRLSGTFPLQFGPTLSQFNHTLSNGTRILLNNTETWLWSDQAVMKQYLNFTWDASSAAIDTPYNVQRNNYTAVEPDFNFTQESLNEGLANVTFSLMFAMDQSNTTVEAQTWEPVNVYKFEPRLNLIIPYFLCLAVAIPFLFLGMVSLNRNGVSAMDGGFLQILMTTTGSKSLEKAAAAGCLGGRENIPKELLDMKIRFGELVEADGHGVGDTTGVVRRAGFGTEDETIPLTRNARYGVQEEMGK